MINNITEDRYHGDMAQCHKNLDQWYLQKRLTPVVSNIFQSSEEEK